MGISAIAHCRWFRRVSVLAEWGADDPDESVDCRASVGNKLVTVWLPRGAVIRLKLGRFESRAEAFSRELRHTFGRYRDMQIRMTLTPNAGAKRTAADAAGSNETTSGGSA